MIILSRSPKNNGTYSSQQYKPPVTKNNDQSMKLLGISSCKLKTADIVTIAHGCWSLEAKFILRFVQLIDKIRSTWQNNLVSCGAPFAWKKSEGSQSGETEVQTERNRASSKLV